VAFDALSGLVLQMECVELRGEPGRRSTMKRMTRDEAFLVAVNIAKLPMVPRQILKDIPRPKDTASSE
jgi:hypothetical protein